MSAFVDAPLLGALADDAVAAKDVVDHDDCLFDVADDDDSWACGLLTPPWSPCDSGDMIMDTCTSMDDCQSLTPVSAVASTTTRARCDSFLCSCTSCECSDAQHADGPVLRDCMWSQTTGLLPPPNLSAQNSGDAATVEADRKTTSGEPCVPCCPAITAGVCSNHTDRCVDPRVVFPHLGHTGALTRPTLCVPSSSSQRLQGASTSLLSAVSVTPDSSVTGKSPVYDPDSETSAYCSSYSGLSVRPFVCLCKSLKLSVGYFELT